MTTRIAAIGNHLIGLPRHFELADRGAVFLAHIHTAPDYRLLARGDEQPPHPGLREVAKGEGLRIAAELFAFPDAALAELAALSLPPISLSRIRLDDGQEVHGYLCEAVAAAEARDVSQFGGWRAFIASLAPH